MARLSLRAPQRVGTLQVLSVLSHYGKVPGWFWTQAARETLLSWEEMLMELLEMSYGFAPWVQIPAQPSTSGSTPAPQGHPCNGVGAGGAVNNATLSHRMKCMKRGEQSVPQVLTAYFIFIPFYVPRYTPGPVSCFVVFLTSMYLLFYLRYNQSVP